MSDSSLRRRMNAERQARWRWRKRKDVRVVEIEVSWALRSAMSEDGLLGECDEDDPSAITNACEEALYDRYNVTRLRPEDPEDDINNSEWEEVDDDD